MLSAKAFFATPAAELTPKMEREFFSSLMTRNKTYKTTFERRFADVNRDLLKHLHECARRPMRVLDLGISSGVSTIELYDDLRRERLDIRVVATDILVDACLVRVGPQCAVLVDDGGFPLRFDLLGASFKPWVTCRDYKTGVFILRKAINIALTHRAGQILRRCNDPRIQRVKLVTPRLLATPDIMVVPDDLRRYNEAFAGGFDFVRAANILNLGYFSPSTISNIIDNIRSYLRGPSALLLVARTHDDGVNHGTLFRLRDNLRFDVIQRFGAGSEVEMIVLQSFGNGR